MKTIYKSLIIGIMTSFSLFSAAMADDNKNLLTLTQAIDIGLKNNHDVKIAERKIEDAKLQIGENAAQGYPQLSMSASYGRQDPVVKSNTAGLGGLGSNAQFAAMLGASSVNSFKGSITASQVIFAGFRVIDGVKLAEINVGLMEEGLRQSKQDAVYQITNSYFNALKAWQVVQVDKESLAQAESYLKTAKIKLDAGTGIKMDVLRAQNQVITVQQTLSKDLNNLEKAKLALNLAIGREMDVPVELNPYATVQELKMENDSKPQFDTALKNRSELIQLRLRKEMSELTATIQSRATWPTVAAAATYNISDTQVIDGNLSDTQNMTYGLSFSWPIFDGMAASNKAQRAQEGALQTQIAIDQTQQRISLEVKQNILDIQEAKERLIMAQKGVEVAKESLRISEISYNEGVGISLNVIDAQVTLLQAKLAVVVAEFDLNTGKAKLYKSLGVDLALN